MQVRTRGRLALEPRAKLGIGRDRVEIEAVEERAYVQPGAADDDCELSARRDLGERRTRVALVLRHVVALARIGDVD